MVWGTRIHDELANTCSSPVFSRLAPMTKRSATRPHPSAVEEILKMWLCVLGCGVVCGGPGRRIHSRPRGAAALGDLQCEDSLRTDRPARGWEADGRGLSECSPLSPAVPGSGQRGAVREQRDWLLSTGPPAHGLAPLSPDAAGGSVPHPSPKFPGYLGTVPRQVSVIPACPSRVGVWGKGKLFAHPCIRLSPTWGVVVAWFGAASTIVGLLWSSIPRMGRT